MECSKPGAIRDEELLAYLGGEKVRPAVGQHLAGCQYCSSRLAAYQGMEQTLGKKLYRWDCPPNQVLGEYQLGLLGREQGAEVKQHLNMCVLCTAEFTALNQFLANDPMLAEPVALPPVRIAVRPVANHHRPVQEAKRALDQLLDQSQAGVRRIIATLIPPSPRFVFERGQEVQLPSWPRKYAAENMQISLQLANGPHRRDALQLIGLVTREGTSLEAFQGTPVQLSSTTQEVYLQTIDDLGNFVFPTVEPATYTLALQFPEGTVVIELLPVTPQE